MNSRTSPLAHLVDAAPAAAKAALDHPTHLVKLGVKGPGLETWAQTQKIALPAQLYDTLPVGADGVLARVGNNELVLECAKADPLWHQFATGLEQAPDKLYRLEQQSVTLSLGGDSALPVLAQTCGLDFSAQALDRIVYTRVAGASCAVLPRQQDGETVYRLWIDYTLAHYMWETLAAIIEDLK